MEERLLSLGFQRIPHRLWEKQYANGMAVVLDRNFGYEDDWYALYDSRGLAIFDLMIDKLVLGADEWDVCPND